MKRKMKVLIACEFSGVVRDAFTVKGHDAWSCDIIESDTPWPCNHIKKDIINVLYNWKWGWDLMVAFPPCTYLCLSGIHWNNKIQGRKQKTSKALEFVRKLMTAPINKIALENPVGIISTHIRKPNQYIQPWQFGHPESKKTGLWLKNLPKLYPTNILTAKRVQANSKSPRWDNQTPSGQNKLGPSKNRVRLRSITYQGIADAMAEQWG